MRRRSLALLAVADLLAGAALAQDAPPAAKEKKRYELAVPTRWEAGETVTVSGVSTWKHTMNAVADGTQAGNTKVSETRTESEIVVRCDEASPTGSFLRGRLYVAKWRRTATEGAPDESVQSAHVSVADGAWKVIHGAKEPSAEGRWWMESEFGEAASPKYLSAGGALADVRPLAVGEVIDANTANPMADAPGPNGRKFVSRVRSTLTLAAAEETPDGVRITLTLESVLPAEDHERRRTNKSKATGRSTGVLGLWHRTSEFAFEMSTRHEIGPAGASTSIELMHSYSKLARPGGKIPEIPAPAPPTPPPAPPGGK